MVSSREGRKYLESFNVGADAYMIEPVDQTQFAAALEAVGLGSDGLSE